MALDLRLLKQLEAAPDQLEVCVALFPEGTRTWTPDSWDGAPGEGFSAIGQICHVRDIETDGYLIRFRRTLKENNPFLASVDGFRLASERRYDSENLAEAASQFRRARAETMELLRSVSQTQATRPARFEGYGDVTFEVLAHFLCSHDQQHVATLHWMLGKLRMPAGSR